MTDELIEVQEYEVTPTEVKLVKVRKPTLMELMREQAPPEKFQCQHCGRQTKYPIDAFGLCHRCNPSRAFGRRSRK